MKLGKNNQRLTQIPETQNSKHQATNITVQKYRQKNQYNQKQREKNQFLF